MVLNIDYDSSDRSVDDIRTASDTLSLEERNEKETIQHPVEITKDAQIGVQKAEAVALVWPKRAVYAIYAWIWFCFFILSMQLSISTNVMYYAYADFSSAPQISQAFILATVISGILQLPIAKVLNIWGRTEGLLVFLGVFIIGLIIMAACHGPSTFAAGYTLYWIGYTALNYILSIFVADTSDLRNRAFTYTFIGLPTVCTAFAGPMAAQAFLDHSSWQWAYGCFAIITFITFIPLAIVFKFYWRKAQKMGIFIKIPSGRTPMQSITHYFHEFDVVGGLLLMAAFVFLLLPFSLETYGLNSYSSASFITMIIIGVLLFPAFIIWEKYFARTHFIKWELFKNRTVLGACILSAIIFFNYYTWDQYFYYYVQVVYDFDASQAGYVAQTYNLTSTIWAILFGVWIRQTKHFKYGCLFFGIPLLILGAGLMIHFRGTDSGWQYLIMCQILIAVGGSTLVIGDEMAIMAASDRDGITMMIALLGIWSSIGGAVGYAAAAAIYANIFPGALLSRLPAADLADFDTIYLGGSSAQMLYPVGSDTRTAINYAWTETQKYECITATALCILAFPAVAMWKNYNVDKKQVKGTVI
ncbi:siderophore iron transporter [Xylariales sp. PMI_506]|nr:siderophore iron transporter [Xylariales sp. PMI_506]